MSRAYATFQPPPAVTMSRHQYLHKRPGSQNWYARMMVPRPLRHAIGKREFIRSLGTSDKRVAQQRVHAIVADWIGEIASFGIKSDDVQNVAKPTARDLREMAAIWGYEESKAELTNIIKAKARRSEDDYDWYRIRLQKRHKAENRRFLIDDTTIWRDVVTREFDRRGWSAHVDDEQVSEFCSTLSRVAIDVYAHGLALMDGRADTFTPSAATQAIIADVQNQHSPGENILTLFDQYAERRQAEGKKRPDTLAQDRKIVASFMEFVGKARSLKSIKSDEVREWRNAMAALPTCYRKHKVYSGMSMQEAAAYAIKIGAKRVSLITVNKNLSALSALFVWAKREGYVETNPCEGLHYDADKRNNPRPPFGVEQLNTILRSPLFTGFERDHKEHVEGSLETRDWRFWIPLVCLFTGARIGEIAQLCVGDLDRQDDRWFIHIRNDESKGQKTKSGLSRPAPVHSQLEKIGFIQFVQDRQQEAEKTGNEKLFPELTLNDRDQNGRASRFWRTYLKRIGLKKGADGLGAHSFRHGLADQLRLAGYFDQDIAVALGHKQTTVTSGYGRVRQGTVVRLSDMIEDAKFDGVDFSHLYA